MNWLRRWRYRREFNKWWNESVEKFMRDLEEKDPMNEDS